ncbi:hypothetical protein ACFQ7F_35135 [Streptomyces sp. NPDC056486]|uniref:hypothetical protein n=1 Tax=Streptomyces sp. NPDC056486 TaxID=3345835 RepID=UPI00367C2F92
MPQPTVPAQPEEPLAEDVILGVDTHKDVHVAAVITVLGAILAYQEFPATGPVTANSSPGHVLSARCAEPAWSAPDLMERPWHAS